MTEKRHTQLFRCLKPLMSSDRDATPRGAVATELGMSEGNLRVALHRLRARFAGSSPEEQDRRNAEMMEAVNATGEAYLSHTKLKGRTVLRLAVGNLRTEERHVRRAWERIQGAAARR